MGGLIPGGGLGLRASAKFAAAGRQTEVVMAFLQNPVLLDSENQERRRTGPLQSSPEVLKKTHVRAFTAPTDPY